MAASLQLWSLLYNLIFPLFSYFQSILSTSVTPTETKQLVLVWELMNVELIHRLSELWKSENMSAWAEYELCIRKGTNRIQLHLIKFSFIVSSADCFLLQLLITAKKLQLEVFWESKSIHETAYASAVA